MYRCIDVYMYSGCIDASSGHSGASSSDLDASSGHLMVKVVIKIPLGVI